MGDSSEREDDYEYCANPQVRRWEGGGGQLAEVRTATELMRTVIVGVPLDDARAGVDAAHDRIYVWACR